MPVKDGCFDLFSASSACISQFWELYSQGAMMHPNNCFRKHLHQNFKRITECDLSLIQSSMMHWRISSMFCFLNELNQINVAILSISFPSPPLIKASLTSTNTFIIDKELTRTRVPLKVECRSRISCLTSWIWLGIKDADIVKSSRMILPLCPLTMSTKKVAD